MENKQITTPKKMVNNSEIVEDFKTEVHDKATEVDPNNELDWFALTIGWALAKGFTPEDAYDFALYIRYETELG